MNKIPVGIIGVGHLGKIHASLYRDVKSAELIGIYDNDVEKAKKVADELNTIAYSDINQLFEKTIIASAWWVKCPPELRIDDNKHR